MKLLVITQKVDAHDQVLGFFVEWLRRLGKKFPLLVICLYAGSFDLSGISVKSMGKERGISKFRQLANFYSYIRNIQMYDAILVHMNPIWVVLGGWYWKLHHKKIILWYTHKSVTLKLRIALWFADAVLTASSESFRLPSPKVIVTGHGIDTDVFKPSLEEKPLAGFNIITVGRIAPVKNYEVLIDAAELLQRQGLEFHITIAGEAILEKDKIYRRGLEDTIRQKNLNSRITFAGRIEHDELPALYGRNNLFVHMSNTGSLDKTILEAMACGLQVVSSNDASRGFLPPELIFKSNSATELAQKIKDSLGRNDNFRSYVVSHHNLDDLINKISAVIES